MATKAIHSRGLTSFFTLFGFLIMAVTGLVLYLEPAGRVAYWTDWRLIGLSKTDWGNIHILSSLLFIVAGAFHTFLNWKPLMNYFKDRVTTGIKLKRELVISSVVSVWIVVAALFPFPPLSYLLDFNLFLKDVWVAQDHYEPPFGHAELLSLKTFSTKMDIDIRKATEELRANGIVFAGVDETLEDIARNNNTSPMEIYLLIKKFEPAPEPEKLKTYTAESIEVEFSGTGIGNKTLRAICENLGLGADLAIGRLQAAGIPASVEQTLKNIAEGHNFEPIDIMKTILLESYRPQADGQ